MPLGVWGSLTGEVRRRDTQTRFLPQLDNISPRSLQALLRAEFDVVTATFTGRLPALIYAEVTRALQAAAPAAETRAGATASGIAASTALCSPETGPVVAAATPSQRASSLGSGVLRLTLSALRQPIVAVLQNRLEGLTPPQVQALIGTDTDLRALM